MLKLSIILLCGGKGLRIGGDVPKQYLPLGNKPVARHSYDTLKEFGEMIVVAPSEWRHLFDEESTLFAEPGERRQDSVWNGLQKATADWILVHDAARPFVEGDDIKKLIESATQTKAATLACPLKFTLKEADSSLNVVNTVDRCKYWEIQTPQLVQKEALLQGFQKARTENLTVTDDVSLAELVNIPVKLVQGSESNFKITTAQDLALAKWIQHAHL